MLISCGLGFGSNVFGLMGLGEITPSTTPTTITVFYTIVE